MIERIDRTAAQEQLIAPQWEQLLRQSGLRSEPPYDARYGIFEDGRLIAAGARDGNRLKCIAVDDAFCGGPVFNELLSGMIRDAEQAGISKLFVYTKPAASSAFEALGFRLLAEVPGAARFMERGYPPFAAWLDKLRAESAASDKDTRAAAGRAAMDQAGTRTGSPGEENTVGHRERVESIVMNASPFTLGHRALIENALARSRKLHLFIVSEDVSLIPTNVRLRLVREGIAGLSGIVLHRSDAYIISRASFPSYFLKKKSDAASVQAHLDAALFCDRIAPALGITNRTVGEEPDDPFTALYNRTLKETFENKIVLTVMPRVRDANGHAVSASRVRALLLSGDIVSIRPLVPESTFRYFNSDEGTALLTVLRETASQ